MFGEAGWRVSVANHVAEVAVLTKEVKLRMRKMEGLVMGSQQKSRNAMKRDVHVMSKL